jgi:Sec-independent protein translocase protein TatA
MMRIIFYVFMFYLLYRFITDLVIPVGRAGKQVRNRMQEMQNAQQEQLRQQQEQEKAQFQKQQSRKASDKDYLDFEEV